MPIYTYKNEETGEIVELLQSVHDKHEYVVGGISWARLWQADKLNIAVDLQSNPFSESKFLEKTNKPGTIGDLWERASDASEERKEKNSGIDPVLEKYSKNKKLPFKRPKDIEIVIE